MGSRQAAPSSAARREGVDCFVPCAHAGDVEHAASDSTAATGDAHLHGTRRATALRWQPGCKPRRLSAVLCIVAGVRADEYRDVLSKVRCGHQIAQAWASFTPGLPGSWTFLLAVLG